MRFGICCSVQDAPEAVHAGFDYVELPAASLLDNIEAYRIARAEATNVFFPGSIKLMGEQAGPYLDYAENVIRRASQIGVQTMVLGSGASRNAPDGFDLNSAEAIFVRVAKELSEIAQSYGITLAPESLVRAETNVGNSLSKLANDLREAGVAYTADSFHVIGEWVLDGYDGEVTWQHWKEELPFLPAHVHIANRPRFAPEPGDEEVSGFTSRLLELGYDGRVSLEYRRVPERSLEDDLRDLRALFGKQ